MNFIKKINFLFLVLTLFLNTFQLSATEKVITLGGESGWEDVTGVVDRLNYTEGYRGYDALGIAAKTHHMNENTDLYISFEDRKVQDESNHYKVLENRVYFTENEAAGKYAGISRENDTMLSVQGEKGSIFGEFGPIGSFSIEFWLCPSVCISGENIIFWRSSRNFKQYSAYQVIDASFMNGKLVWKFTNLFHDVDENTKDFVLTSHSNIMPEKWSHHYICYDSQEGTLEYYINSHLEDLVFTSDNGNAYGQFLTPNLGSPSKIEICKNYVGAIDEIVISHSVRHYLDTVETTTLSPHFVSKPLDTKRNGSKIGRVDAIIDAEFPAYVLFFARAAEYPYELYDYDQSEIEWVEIKNGVPQKEITGRYFQIAAHFFDAGKPESSPALSQVDIYYEEADLPIPPVKIVAIPSDSKVEVSWSNNNFDGKYGYLLYYGTKSGEFIGVDIDQGDSPIDCGTNTSITLTGLQNAQIYYFTVAAYLLDFPDIIGEPSSETYARPMR